MSHTLFFIVEPPRKKSLSDRLKFILRERYEFPINVTFGMESIPYLRGLHDAGGQEMKADILLLIAQIEKFGSVDLWEEM